MNDGDLTLLSAVTANSNGTAAEWGGGQGLLSAWGTWDGATVTLQHSPDGGTTWINVPGGAFTANDSALMSFPARKKLRAVVSGVGTSSLNCIFEKA